MFRRQWRWLCKSIVPTSSQLATGRSPVALYSKLVDPALGVGEVAALAAELAPQLRSAGGALSIMQRHHLLETLSLRSVRHEGVLQQCIWSILKAQRGGGGGGRSAADALSDSQLALYTSSTFYLMALCGFKHDSQMIALALGRCVELASAMPFAAVVKVYQALAALDQAYFSLASVALYDAEVDGDFNAKDPLTDNMDTGRHDLATLASQPNLIDVLCGALEARLGEFCATPSLARDVLLLTDGGPQQSWQDVMEPAAAAELRNGGAGAGARPEPVRSVDQARRHLLVLLGELTRSLSAVGASDPASFAHLRHFFAVAAPSWQARGGGGSGAAAALEMKALAVGSALNALRDAARVHERVIDPMNHEDSLEFQEARAALCDDLAARLADTTGLAGLLRRHPPLVLSARALFEELPELAERTPRLWDQVRCVRVSQHNVVAAKSASRPPDPRLGGRLFAKNMAVKVRRISQELSAAERFVPPQFKTWRGPAHTTRGGHTPHSRGPGRAVKFGTKRISRNYIKNKRTKYGQL